MSTTIGTGRRQVFGVVKDSALNTNAGVAATSAPSILKPVSITTQGGIKGKTTTVTNRLLSDSFHLSSSFTNLDGDWKRSSSSSSSLASKNKNKKAIAKAFNSTLAHQPLGQGDWLRGSSLSTGATSTAYEAWKDETDRRRQSESGDFEVIEETVSWNRDPEMEEHVFDIFQHKGERERFAPEEVDTLVSIIAEKEKEKEKDSELTMSSCSEDEDDAEEVFQRRKGGEKPNNNKLGSTSERPRGSMTPAHLGNTERDGKMETFDSSSPQLQAEVEVKGDIEDEGDAFELNVSSHMVVVDRVVKLELEKERATKKLSEWAHCAHELQDLFKLKSEECKAKDLLAAKLNQDLDKKGEEICKLNIQLKAGEQVEKHLRQELVLKEQLIKESHETCGKLRTALMDAELELERQDQMRAKLLPKDGGASSSVDPSDSNSQALSKSTDSAHGEEEHGNSVCNRLRADLERQSELLLKKDERIMKQDFELEKSKVQIFQQKQQIALLNQELSRLKMSASASTGSSGQRGKHQQVHEKGQLIEELALQIEEGSREIMLIQDKLKAANPIIFGSVDNV